MATHKLSAEQMRKFICALGGSDEEAAGGEFTTEQLLDIAEDKCDLWRPPDMTDDPRVNYAVDCVVHFDEDEGVEEAPYDEALYAEEAAAYKADPEGFKS